MNDLILIALATWYVSYSLSSTHGPGGIFEWIRENVWHGRRGETFVEIRRLPDGQQGKEPHWEKSKNGLLDCIVCLAPWAALILLLVPMGIVVQALALAGGAMLLHGIAGWRFGSG